MSMAIFGMGATVADFGSIVEVVDIAFTVNEQVKYDFSTKIQEIKFDMEVTEWPL